jgi:hypothetical protein
LKNTKITCSITLMRKLPSRMIFYCPSTSRLASEVTICVVLVLPTIQVNGGTFKGPDMSYVSEMVPTKIK